MRKFRLLLAAFCCFTVAVPAAKAASPCADSVTMEEVMVVGYKDDNTIDYIRHFYRTVRPGWQQSAPPKFMIVGNDHNFIFGIGGYVAFRTAYDFNGVVQNKDFVTADIPVTSDPANRQRFLMDASTSRLFFRLQGNKGALKGLEAYIEADFRGSGNAFHLRKAYVSYRGLLLGQNVTTFSDLDVTPTLVDFQGPNGYAYRRNLMIQYTRLIGAHWNVGIAAEMPTLSATYSAREKEIPQRVPDFPLFVQYGWKCRNPQPSHIRFAALFRDLYYRDEVAQTNRSRFGWGVQLSANVALTPKFSAFAQGVYGRGISPYIQDLQGLGMDLVQRPGQPGTMQTLPMLGWFGGLRYDITSNVEASAAYGQARVYNVNGYYVPDMYRNTEYLAANVFWTIIPSCKVGVEYLYGTRTNMDKASGKANRIHAMIQYNF